MIAAQKEALEAARRSREDALKATKVREMSSFCAQITHCITQIKSNFLASMSHELRTPFRYKILIFMSYPILIYRQFFLWVA
jgi:signal transduction histidine kinase